MKLSEAIAMVEEWLDEHTYNYKIYKVKATGKGRWKIRFLEYNPFGGISCDTYFYIPFDKRCIYNFRENDLLEVGRDAYGNDEEMLKWYDEFERRWNYGNETTD